MWNRTSVSQYKTYTDCNLKWFLEKIEGIQKPDTPATRFGKDFHTFLEESIIGGKLLSNSYFNPFVKKNPKFFKWLMSLEDPILEGEFNPMLPVSKIPLKGYIDLQYTIKKIKYLDDHKTCKNWTYTETVDTLGSDIQMNVYAHYKQPHFITHHQFNKSTFQYKKVQVPFNPEEGKAAVTLVDLAAVKMRDDSTKDIKDISCNKNSCGKYGGCPFRDYCKSKVTLEELKFSMDNPFFKEEREKKEVQKLDSTERLDELSKEVKFNHIAKDLNMSIQDKLAKLQNRQKAEIEIPMTEVEPEEVTEQEEIITEKVLIIKSDAEVEEAERSEKVKNMVATGLISEEHAKDIVEKDWKAEKPKTRKRKTKKKETPVEKCNVFVGCMVWGEDIKHATELLDDAIQPILEKHKCPNFSAIPFNEGLKDMATIGDAMLDALKEQGDFRLDTKLPLDGLIYSLIFQHKRENEFRIIRSVF